MVLDVDQIVARADRADELVERIGKLTERRRDALDALKKRRLTPRGKRPDVHQFHGTIASLSAQIASAERQIGSLLDGDDQ